MRPLITTRIVIWPGAGVVFWKAGSVDKTAPLDLEKTVVIFCGEDISSTITKQ